MTQTSTAPMTDATALNLISRIDEPSGASVGMWRGVHCAPIEWAEIFRAQAQRGAGPAR